MGLVAALALELLHLHGIDLLHDGLQLRSGSGRVRMAVEHLAICRIGIGWRAGSRNHLPEEGATLLCRHVVHGGSADLDLDESHSGRGGPEVRGTGQRSEQRCTAWALYPLCRRLVVDAGRAGHDLLLLADEHEEPALQPPIVALGILDTGPLLPLCRDSSLSV